MSKNEWNPSEKTMIPSFLKTTVCSSSSLHIFNAVRVSDERTRERQKEERERMVENEGKAGSQAFIGSEPDRFT